MRRPLAILLLAAAAGVAGCDASGEAQSTRTFSDAAVPFTFSVPIAFTNEPIDQGDSRGDVVAAAGLTKVDLLAVRRLLGSSPPSGPVAHEVQGHAVTSEVRPIPGFGGWFLECQYTGERRTKVRHACSAAVASVKRR